MQQQEKLQHYLGSVEDVSATRQTEMNYSSIKKMILHKLKLLQFPARHTVDGGSGGIV